MPPADTRAVPSAPAPPTRNDNRLWLDAKKKRARDIYGALTRRDAKGLCAEDVQAGIQHLGLPCDWRMAEGLFLLLRELKDSERERSFVTMIEFNDSLRATTALTEAVTHVTDLFSHGEDRRKLFDLRAWLCDHRHRLRLAETALHVYMDATNANVAEVSLQGCSPSDAKTILLLELSGLPCDPLTFASARVLLRHLGLGPSAASAAAAVTGVGTRAAARSRGDEGAAAGPASALVVPDDTVTSVADKINEACEVLYGGYVGADLAHVVGTLNAKIAALTKTSREEQRRRVAAERASADLERDLAASRASLAKATTESAEWRALLQLNQFRYRQGRRQGEGPLEGTHYDVDVRESLIVSRHTKAMLKEAKEEAAWWRGVHLVSSARFRALYMRGDAHRREKERRMYKRKYHAARKRLWRVAATASWLQEEFNSLSKVVEHETKRKIARMQVGTHAHAHTHGGLSGGVAEEPRTPGSASQPAGSPPLANTRTGGGGPSSSGRDRVIEELGSHIVHLNAKVDRERIKALKAVEDKEKSILSLRKRIHALEHSIVRESERAPSLGLGAPYSSYPYSHGRSRDRERERERGRYASPPWGTA